MTCIQYCKNVSVSTINVAIKPPSLTTADLYLKKTWEIIVGINLQIESESNSPDSTMIVFPNLTRMQDIARNAKDGITTRVKAVRVGLRRVSHYLGVRIMDVLDYILVLPITDKFGMFTTTLVLEAEISNCTSSPASAVQTFLNMLVLLAILTRSRYLKPACLLAWCVYYLLVLCSCAAIWTYNKESPGSERAWRYLPANGLSKLRNRYFGIDASLRDECFFIMLIIVALMIKHCRLRTSRSTHLLR